MCAVEKVISGGQTGADQGGLEAGRALGLETGGTAPPAFMTEVGRCKYLLESFGLVEGRPDSKLYPKRTERNVVDSVGTVIFGSTFSAGSRLTLRLCGQYKRPYVAIPHPGLLCLADIKYFRCWLDDNGVLVLNVAGNRESKSPGLQEHVRCFMIASLS